MKGKLIVVLSILLLITVTGIYGVSKISSMFIINGLISEASDVEEEQDNNLDSKIVAEAERKDTGTQQQESQKQNLMEQEQVAQREVATNQGKPQPVMVKSEEKAVSPAKPSPQTSVSTAPDADKVANGGTDEIKSKPNVSNKSQNKTEESSDEDSANNILSSEKVKDIESKVAPSDKTKAMSIVLKSLKPQDYAELIQAAKDGVTEQEKQRAIEILKSRLTPEQKEQLKALYEKYSGLLD